MADTDLITAISLQLEKRALPEGGFEEQPGGGYRSDATAWSIIALSALNSDDKKGIEFARDRLGSQQLKDGRVSISIDHPDAFWPTPLAVLAWNKSPQHDGFQSKAIKFLIETSGDHWKRKPDSPVCHDTAIRGWPWVEETHSWVEPTALAVIALRASGYENHPRVTEATEMLLDRQLPHGGWNYGNTRVFGQELPPFPDPTGMALMALSGVVERKFVGRSLDYLKGCVDFETTPFSLAWSLLGLAPWSEIPDNASEKVFNCFGHQEIFGVFTTSELSLLALAVLSTEGIALL